MNMASRITVYYVRFSDYQRNIGAMNDEKLEEVLDRSKVALKLDRKGLSAIVAESFEIRPGSGKKVSIAKGIKFRGAITKGLHLAVQDFAEKNQLSMPDIHTLTGSGLIIEAFNLKPGNKMYGGYFVVYA